MSLLSLIVFTPLLGAIIVMCLPAQQHDGIRRGTLGFSVIPFLLSLLLVARFDAANAGMQFFSDIAWIPQLGIRYTIGVDGISLFLILLTTFIMPIVVLAGWNDVHKRIKEYMVLLLVLETAMLGAFVSLDLFLFYVFWEAMLIPMYLLIGIWGGARRIYAAMKLFIYTMTGSVLMLIAMLSVVWMHHAETGTLTFSFEQLLATTIPGDTQWWLFGAFALAFAIKVPMFPVHTWLPDAHTEAPTGGSVILAAVLLKMGTYGFLRFAFPLFPLAVQQWAPCLATLAAIGIVYGAWMCFVQRDVKRLVAYSSVSHLGFVMLGLVAMNVQSIEGSIYQMLNHGLSTGALFLAVGVIYERRHTRLMSEFGGLWKQLPVYGAIFLFIVFSSAGLPGLNGFVGEFLILIGAFDVYPVATTIGVSGVIFGAVYLLWMYQKVMLGPLENPANSVLKDISPREIMVFVPLLIMIVVMGVYPQPFLSRMEPTVQAYIERLQERTARDMARESAMRVSAQPDKTVVRQERTGATNG